MSLVVSLTAQEPVKIDSPGAKNPLFPGWFADPTVAEFGDIYYIYATTDNEMLGSGAPTVWYSRDFQNWYNYTMEIPSLSSINLRNYWAPDILVGDNGKYYLNFGNCQAGCNVYGYVSADRTMDEAVREGHRRHSHQLPEKVHRRPDRSKRHT